MGQSFRSSALVPHGFSVAAIECEDVAVRITIYIFDDAALVGSEQAIGAASQDELAKGLMSLHAFTEQSRFVKGGVGNLPATFWKANNGDVAK